jgi:hypothetical protein
MWAEETITAENTDDLRWRLFLLFWIEDAWRDFRFALRSLAKMPGFTAVAVILIAVGIGCNTAVFSVINTVLLKPLTYPEPQSLVQLMETGPQGSFQGASVPKFNILRQQTSVFQYVAGYDQGGAGLNLTGGVEPEQVQGLHVTADYFRLFGAPILAGRTFTAAEDSPHGGHVVVLSYGLWSAASAATTTLSAQISNLMANPSRWWASSVAVSSPSKVGTFGCLTNSISPRKTWPTISWWQPGSNPALRCPRRTRS